jgi:hypothetical protein
MSQSFPPEKGATTEEQRAAKLRAKNVPRGTSSVTVPAAAQILSDAVKLETRNAVAKLRRWAKI